MRGSALRCPGVTATADFTDLLQGGLLTVHAHPDDETISTGGILAAAAAEGRTTTVVTCTGGEHGTIFAADVDVAAVAPRLAEVRAGELAAALEILGVSQHRPLGYVDSGIVGADTNADPHSFWRADVDEAVGHLVAVIRAVRPEVLVTYDAFGGYGHPDHVQTHRVAVLAVEAAAMAALYPDGGPAWRTPKVYYSTLPKHTIALLNAAMTSAGMLSPFGTATDPAQVPMGTPDAHVTATVDVSAHVATKRRALLAHHSQIGPGSAFFDLPDELVDPFFAVEHYTRLRSDVEGPARETDLFAGL